MNEFVSEILVNIGLAILILIVGIWAAAQAKKLILRLLDRYDVTLASFVASFCRYAILTVMVIVILDRFGVETASLMVVLGSAGLAIGLALQGTLSSVASGLMLLIFRPFNVGDHIDVGGFSGTVSAINLFMTEMNTPNNVKIIMPNANVWGGSIVNYSAHDTRRADLIFGVSYTTDLKKAEKAIKDVLAKEKRVNKKPEPTIVVSALNDSSVDFTVRVWCASSDYWSLQYDLTRAIKENFDKQQIDIPFPTRTIIQAS